MGVVARSEEPINELFVRLNRSKSLTGAEVRNAMTGPAPEIIRQLTKHEFFLSNVSFSVQRGQDLNAAGKLLVFEYKESPQETKRRNLDAFVADVGKGSKEKLELSGRRVLETLDDMASIFLPADKLLSSAGIVPVYYWFVRSSPESDYHRIREFLVYFERERKANREPARGANGRAFKDETLSAFDAFNRSTNDIKSHLGRFDILKKRFSLWKRGATSERR